MRVREIREEYKKLIDEAIELNRLGALKLKENMERSDLYFKGRFTSKFLQIPRLYTDDDIKVFENIAGTAHGIFERVIGEYLKNAEYRALFGFSREAEELILAPSGYDSLLPIARFDIFYHEESGKFWFCEINTDGSSGMNEDRLQDNFMIHNPAHQEMRRRYDLRTMELFDSWVETFLSIYDTYKNRVEEPNIAIVDFLDGGTLREFEEFERRFQRAGVNCEICDIRELEYQDHRLISPSGHAVDAIYRRAVTADILKNMDSVGAFLSAVREGTCFVAGSFKTQIIHHKRLFYVLRHQLTKAILTDEENSFVEEHIPVTVPFEREHIDLVEVVKNKDRYILKPEDSYASSGVFAGVEKSEDEWRELAAGAYENGYICQEYCPQHSSENIDLAFGDGKWHSYIDMAGLFVYNGRFAGVFSRAAEGDGIIASHRNERTQPTYIVRKK